MLVNAQEFANLRDPLAISWSVVTVLQDWLAMTSPRYMRRLCNCGCQG